MKKHIWIMNHYASGMYFNKGGRHYWFAKFLRKQGYEPVVFCCNTMHNGEGYYIDTDKLWLEKQAEEINTPWVFIKARTYKGNGKDRVLNMIDFYFNLKKTAKEYAKLHGKPDVILASSVHPLTLVAGIQLAKYFGVKCICEVRDLWPESIVVYSDRLTKNNPIIKMLYSGEKWIYKKADAIIMTWEGGYQYICDQGWSNDISQNKVVHISNGVDLQAFDENLNIDNNIFNSDKKIFTYTGSVRKVNNLKMIVDAAEILNKSGVDNVLIKIYGDGDEREQLDNIVKEKNLNNIQFLGKVHKTKIPQILKNSHVLILHNTSTELNKYGQSQNKFFEYLASEKPILMTYSVGYSVIKSNECGIELDIQSSEEIANKIEYMANLDNIKYQEFCDNCSTIKKEYDFKELTNKLITLIEKIG